MSFEVDALLAGPRGREVCVAAAASCAPAVGQIWWAAGARSGGPAAADLAAALRAFDPGVLLAADDVALLDPLANGVCSAMCWQEPFERERLLTDDQALGALVPVAEAVLRSPGAAWWSSPVPRERQHAVTWGRSGTTAPPAAAAALRDWREAAVVHQARAADLPPDVRANVSGCWWSAPVTAGLMSSSRSLGRWDAVGMFLVEECQGDFDTAVVQRIEVADSARVYEVDSPGAWVRLAEQYPLEVTRSRRHDWWRVTGLDGRWVIPDWQAVPADWDGVHLRVAAYIAGAGRALPVGSAATVIAGWDPDQTYWLTDGVRAVDDGAVWVLPEEAESPSSWTRE